MHSGLEEKEQNKERLLRYSLALESHVIQKVVTE